MIWCTRSFAWPQNGHWKSDHSTIVTAALAGPLAGEVPTLMSYFLLGSGALAAAGLAAAPAAILAAMSLLLLSRPSSLVTMSFCWASSLSTDALMSPTACGSAQAESVMAAAAARRAIERNG